MQDKILSIIVPSYNMEALLPRCLASLEIGDNEILQKLDVIVVNDGSKDHTSEIAHEFASRHPDVFRVVDKCNGNYGSCVNAALPLARGLFVRILDADDTYDSDGLCHLIKCLDASEQHDEHIDMFLTPYVTFNGSGDIIGKVDFEWLLQDKTFAAEDLSMISRAVAMHAVTYRLSNLMTICYRQTEGISYTDTEWCFMPVVGIGRWKYIPVSVYRYYVGREGQTVSRSSTIKNFWMYKALFKRMMLWYKARAFNSVYCPYLRNRLELLSAIIYQIIIAWLPLRKAVVEFDIFDELMRNDDELYEAMSTLSISRFAKWHYVSYLRRRSPMRVGYLVMLRAYLWLKDIVIHS